VRASAASDEHRLTVFTGYFCGDPSTLPPAPPHIPRGWDAVGSNPADVASKLQSLVDAGADSIVLVPFGDDAVGQIRVAHDEVAPLLSEPPTD